MGLIDHLDELRKRLIIVAVAFVIFFIVGFAYVEEIYKFITRDIDKLAVLGPSDILWIYFMIATIVALVFTVPVIAWQIWLFVKPALSKKEQRTALFYIPSLFVLFVGGFAFMFTADKYFKFVLNMTIPFAVLFEMPVVVMFLTSIGLINPITLTKVRKYAYFVLIVTAILISPPDFMSDFVVAVPLLIVYEISVNLSRVVFRKKLRDQKNQEALELEQRLEDTKLKNSEE
ncbi:MAG: preprotein translocase subunit TatC [Bacillales bacterium]|nr:preprotein translocase subunit TatC [Bacillales bacterium]